MACAVSLVVDVALDIRVGGVPAAPPGGIHLIQQTVLAGDILITHTGVSIWVIPAFKLGAAVIAPIIFIDIGLSDTHIPRIVGGDLVIPPIRAVQASQSGFIAAWVIWLLVQIRVIQLGSKRAASAW